MNDRWTKSSIAFWLVFLAAGILAAGYWRGFNIALLLVCWIPILYGVSLLASGERKLVDELRADALWFAVSLPKSYEHGFGYGRVFKWCETLPRTHASQDYSKEKRYFFDIGSGLLRVSGDELGQRLEFVLGSRNNILEVPRNEALRLSRLCKAYCDAAERTRVYFGLLWLAVQLLSFCVIARQNLIALCVAIWVIVLWGVLPRRSLRDLTEDFEFLCRKHKHVYAYWPGDNEKDPAYTCICGKIEPARDL